LISEKKDSQQLIYLHIRESRLWVGTNRTPT